MSARFQESIVVNPEEFGLLMDHLLEDMKDLDLGPAFQDIIDGPLTEQVEASFASESGPDGTPWEPWHYRTWWAPEEHPTLFVSGKLKDSFTGGGEGHHEIVDAQEFEWGSDLIYAGIQNYGASFVLGIDLVGRDGVGYLPAGHQITIPQRPIVGWSEDTIAKAEAILYDYIADQLGAE